MKERTGHVLRMAGNIAAELAAKEPTNANIRLHKTDIASTALDLAHEILDQEEQREDGQ